MLLLGAILGKYLEETGEAIPVVLMTWVSDVVGQITLPKHFCGDAELVVSDSSDCWKFGLVVSDTCNVEDTIPVVLGDLHNSESEIRDVESKIEQPTVADFSTAI